MAYHAPNAALAAQASNDAANSGVTAPPVVGSTQNSGNRARTNQIDGRKIMRLSVSIVVVAIILLWVLGGLVFKSTKIG